ncbi:class I SAM-dependent methyltransferase [Anaerosacchariphilus polymeriproducens]|uniref:Class I SAM-dependent methyltransferase n=1 Tax=Anaerosacchariphilus polymeriproducens TaxID=1812858 RepID=A0A371ARE2_9FIRM|nr:class I SAM-dependent methyltransferase [Anaerosacchariphilus polymeriproducens]RDU22138.1 class I SAM-dependent methyltransferase [Anaerosacchariphilus polymeriproducens]
MYNKIGNVTLNYDHYSGKDLYSDGEIEDVLLKLVQDHEEEELNEVIYQSKDWAVLYHLSHIRQNIVSWLPIQKTDKVLEIGSGCGAITGALAQKALEVKCIELSQKRSLINANRNKKFDNIEILLGNFQDVEAGLTQKFDYITLIGVFEYGEAYIQTENPYVDFLKKIKKHLNKNGKLVIAIENRLGLKYWAGCKEDHFGTFFEGLEGYTTSCGVKTFSKVELESILKEAGLGRQEFYYPYPDYKLPMTIYSDNFLPKEGELNNNMNNFDRERMVLFDETKVFNSLIRDGLFPLFSNSYLVLAELGKEEE